MTSRRMFHRTVYVTKAVLKINAFHFSRESRARKIGGQITMSAEKRISSVCRAGGREFNSLEHTYSQDRSVSRRRHANYTYTYQVFWFE